MVGDRPWTSLQVLFVSLVVCSTGCASAIHRPATAPATEAAASQRGVVKVQGRPAVGVAFGGGSARGLAHVGVIRWLEEHRIPIDLVAGTSMGGLVGGSFSTGMDADELEQTLVTLDWDELFGDASFAFKNIRRKADARSYPTRLEFGLRGGLVAPTALNSGEQVDLLLARIAGPYWEIATFDELPTPFRAVAVDLISASEVVLDRGSLVSAMRATMSLPLIFPPVEIGGRVLVDGGAMNNVPADVVRAMGAERVIAVNVGELSNPEGVNYSMLGLASGTIDAMMRASTRAALASADIIVNVPLEEYGSLDWRRSRDLIREGHRAAESMRNELLPLAVSEQDYADWRQARASRRRNGLPVPAFVGQRGIADSDARRLDALVRRHVGVPLDIDALERDIAQLGGLDRYETIGWQLERNAAGDLGVVVVGRSKPYAPPFMMLGLNLENTTSTDFRVTASGRYLAYGIFTSGSELRIDGTVGSYPSAAIALHQPLGGSPLFASGFAGLTTDTITSLDDEERVVARYDTTTWRVGVDLGANLGLTSDLRLGVYTGHVDASVEVGETGLPELRGSESGLATLWRLDGQDSPVVPSRGTFANVRLTYILDGADGIVGGVPVAVDGELTQLSATMNRFWSVGERNRVFVLGGLGTSFDGTALPTSQYRLGLPFRLGAYGLGELRGSHYYLATSGVLRQFGRLPDFLGGPAFVGAWLENGDAFEAWTSAKWRSNASLGVILDTIVGPVFLGGSAGFDGRWRTYVGVGRVFR